MKKITLGIVAHVDSGKTTLSEALLFKTGALRTAGRVDKGNSALDTDDTERERGITIFAHQADFISGGTQFFLVDTPGHVDFSAETERALAVLDIAVLVVSATDGVQSHTVTLWKLLEKYNIPVFIFINKTDLPNASAEKTMEDLRRRLSANCADFSGGDEETYENCAMCSEELMEKYLTDSLSDDDIISEISERNIFPCCHGSALKMTGIEKFLEILERFSAVPQRRQSPSAKVFKISYDGTCRLTHVKITGGTFKVRDELHYKNSSGEDVAAKISGIRFVQGGKFRTADSAQAGDVCCMTGLPGTYAGQGIGKETDSGSLLAPVMTWKVNFPRGMNISEVLRDMRTLEESEPQLHVAASGEEITVQLMGAVQTEILSQMIFRRFGYSVTFVSGSVAYRETITDTAEGIGHYEPLRHYAEVHLVLEPLPRGTGLVFESSCSEDTLAVNWQRLVMTHLAEKSHAGILTGSPVTDIKITLAAGKAHLKHTEGGDFRQATYRAVRQGLRTAHSVLLEPFYNFELEIPTENTGRAIADLQRMSASFQPPEVFGAMSVIRGTAPVSEINGYPEEVTAYTHGTGRLACFPGGYMECHNAHEVIAAVAYDPDSDVENSADSVFCTHGAGYVVKWNEVPGRAHVPPVLSQRSPVMETYRANAPHFVRSAVSDEELREIFERTYGKINRDPRRAFKKTKAVTVTDVAAKSYDFSGKDYLLVDGYNIIFSWEELSTVAEESLDSARAMLINMMCSYQGFTGCELILVFDAWKVPGACRTEKYCNINIVWTKESETADTFIEKATHELARNNRVRVATSDGMEQLIILGNGAMRISAREFHEQYLAAERAIKEFIR